MSEIDEERFSMAVEARFSMAVETRLELWEDAFELWISSRQSANTQKAYRKAWGLFTQFVAKPAWEVSRTDMAHWVIQMQAQGLAAKTINCRVNAVKAFFYYAMEEYEIVAPDGERKTLHDSNPAVGRGLRLRSAVYENAYYLNAEEARALLEAIPQDSVRGKRDYALILFYLATGRRNSEVRNLRWGDFEERDGGIWYRWSGKGKRNKLYECPRTAWEAIKAYLAAAGRLESIQDQDYIFTALSERARRLPNVKDWKFGIAPISSGEVGRILKRRARQAGLDPTRIHVQSLRHTAAMVRKESGMDIYAISKFLSHSQVQITQIYLHEIEGRGDTTWGKVGELLGLI